MVFDSEIAGTTLDIIKVVSSTVYGKTLESEEVGKIVKRGPARQSGF